ncbi:MAG: two-component sensor histidine kinase, partial [Clostridium sp.]
MKRSIRWKFTVTFISLMTLTIVATWCINTFWLEDYYLSYKMDVLEQAYNSIDTIMQQEEAKGGDALGQAKEAVPDVSQNLSGVITQLRDTSNITLLIYDSIKDQTLVSSAGDIEVLKERVSRYIVGKNTPEHQILEEHDNYMIQKTYDP